ncbi:MAG: aldehyde ferredoxin oxidoreductase family protein, partial [Thermoplasmatota archaeon]
MKGVFGKYLVIDLDNQGFEEFDVPKSWYEKYFGGRGVAARIIYSEMPEKIDAFDSRNLLVFSTGPLQGTGLPGAGRNLVMAKSPKTGSVSDSFVGGFFPHELGRSGYDGLVIKGKADSPKYITVNENDIRDADDLWEKETAEVENTLRKRHDGGRVCSIGVAGEKKVNFACVINDRNRAAGRPGFGAVMGDKNLKAIIVKGEKDKPIYDKEGFEEKKKRFTEALSSSPVVDWGKYGSTSTLLSLNEIGSLPTENFKKGEFEDAEEISGEQMYEKILVERDNCTSCPVRCKRVVSTEFNDEKVEEKYGGPEYETLASFGSLCRNSDLDSIALANQLCNKYGLDTISTGNIISSLMEASEKKTIDFEVEWGDPEKIIELIEKIAKRKGIGDELAKGMNYIKNELDVPGLEVKGQEVPMHEPRAKKALALSYATSPRGATHLETMHDTLSKHPRELPIHGEISRFDLEHKPRFCKVYEDLVSFSNSVIMCSYTSWVAYQNGIYVYPKLREAINKLT